MWKSYDRKSQLQSNVHIRAPTLYRVHCTREARNEMSFFVQCTCRYTWDEDGGRRFFPRYAHKSLTFVFIEHYFRILDGGGGGG